MEAIRDGGWGLGCRKVLIIAARRDTRQSGKAWQETMTRGEAIRCFIEKSPRKGIGEKREPDSIPQAMAHSNEAEFLQSALQERR